jgi:hypothetical protein
MHFLVGEIMVKLGKLAIGTSLSLLSGVAIAFPTSAATINGFNASFGTATTTGDASIQGAFAGGPLEGSGQALITTADTSESPALNFSGTSVTSAQGPLEAFLGLTPGALDTANGSAFEGSAIRQTFTAAAGDTLEFNWKFLTNELSDSDYAFIVLNGALTTLANVSNATNISSPFDLATGFSTFSTSALLTGSNTISFGVVDIIDGSAASGLLVDNLVTSPVPFEFSPAVGLLALGALYGCDRLRRKLKHK